MELKEDEKRAIMEVAKKWSDPFFCQNRVMRYDLQDLRVTPDEDLFNELDFISETRFEELGDYLEEVLRKATIAAKAAAEASLEESFKGITIKRW